MQLVGQKINTVKTLYTDTHYNSKFFTTSVVFAQMYQLSLNLNSLQQKFRLTSNYFGTNTVAVKKVVCTLTLYILMDSSFWFDRSHPGVMDKPPALYPGVLGSIPDCSSLSDETLGCGPISIWP